MEEEAHVKMQIQVHQADAVQDVPSSETEGINNSNNDIVVHTTPTPAPAPTSAKRGGSSRNTRASSRCTRSQVAPRWTVEDTLVLLNEIASLDDDWFKTLSSYQRWKMISDNCVTMDVLRSSNQCKIRWNFLLTRYNKIRIWESKSAPTSGSYWSLQPASRKQFGLPASFNQEVFGSMDAVIKAQEARTASAAAKTDSEGEDLIGLHEEAKDDSNDDSKDALEAETSDSDYLIDLPEAKGHAGEVIGMLEAEMAAEDADSGSEEMGTETVKGTDKELLGSEETGTETIKGIDKEQEMVNKLKENAEEIHAILRGEIPDNVSQGRGPVDLMKPNAIETEFKRRQADELIKAFGVLASTLDQFKELIKNGECEGISLMNSMAL